MVANGDGFTVRDASITAFVLSWEQEGVVQNDDVVDNVYLSKKVGRRWSKEEWLQRYRVILSHYSTARTPERLNIPPLRVFPPHFPSSNPSLAFWQARGNSKVARKETRGNAFSRFHSFLRFLIEDRRVLGKEEIFLWKYSTYYTSLKDRLAMIIDGRFIINFVDSFCVIRSLELNFNRAIFI